MSCQLCYFVREDAVLARHSQVPESPHLVVMMVIVLFRPLICKGGTAMQYRNPILKGDYSDPDIVRVGHEFYMISSSFTYIPGIPVLRSADLVHWTLIGYAAARLPFDRYRYPAHKRGTWAPSIRWHNGLLYVYVCLPDEGLLAFTAKDPSGEWECHWVHDVCGWIDPCPLFDEDGRAWLVHGFAASRCGINNLLYVHEMSPDGFHVLDKGTLIYNGADHGDTTVEGPKWYKRQGLYWILCPAGGVKPGYQLALRSDHLLGPYERRIVLRQGQTDINGPHQGGWIDDGQGGDWFIHFQDVGAYGRVPHLQPVSWESGWPVMGKNGEPVLSGNTKLPACPSFIPTSDDFRQSIGLQWQWQANPDSAWYSLLRPGLRLYAAPADSLFHAGQFLSQLMQAYDFDLDIQMHTHLMAGDRAGIGMMGYPYHYVSVAEGRLCLVRGDILELGRSIPEQVTETALKTIPLAASSIRLRLSVRQGNMTFLYANAEENWQQIGQSCPLSPGGWTGARPGICCWNSRGRWGGWTDVKYVRFTEHLPELQS